MIDTHCHLFAEDFKDDRTEIVFRAKEAGISQILMPNIDDQTLEALENVAQAYQGYCLPMMGLHPCSVDKNFEQVLESIHERLERRNYIAIGETGLDYYWDTTYIKEQQSAFQAQIEWAKDKRLPLVIHTRKSFEDVIRMVSQAQDGNLKGVFHCFDGSVNDGEKIMDAGFMMGIGGMITFKNSNLSNVLPQFPLEYILLETDSPYLAPVPHRGKRNEPSYLKLILQRLADVYQMPAEEVEKKTTENAKSLFQVRN